MSMTSISRSTSATTATAACISAWLTWPMQPTRKGVFWVGARQVDRGATIAGKPRSHRFCVVHKICGQHKSLWERGLPAKRPDLPTSDSRCADKD